MDERMNDLVKNYADQHGMSVVEVREMITRVQILWGELKEKMTEISHLLAESIKDITKWLRELEEQSDKQVYGMTWDNRKKSQVMNRKPKFVHARSRL